MEENTLQSNQEFLTESEKKYYPLGKKTFFMLVLKRSFIFFILLPILLFGLIALNYIPSYYIDIAVNIIFIYIAFLLLVFLVAFLISWLEYFRYSISIGNKDLKIKKGLIATEEIGIPYRRIRDVKIKRSLIDQIFGVSDIVVILSDFEEKDTLSDESIIFLPSLEKNIAVSIQESVLKKSQVEQIDVLSGHDNIVNKIK